MILFWVSTPCHEEDWFVVAKSYHAATKFFEDHEGFNRGDAKAKKVFDLEDTDFDSDRSGSHHPSHELIESIGGNIDWDGYGRVVTLNGKTYYEGTFLRVRYDDDLFVRKEIGG